jgi:uncharacterized membrane protein YdbT with pleckstrin-like domain
MSLQVFKPSSNYLPKMLLNITLIAVGAAAASGLLGWLIGLDEGADKGRMVTMVFWVVIGAWWLVAAILVGPYYRSLKYEIHEDEVIVRVGILVKSVKHVPYRTVTNITVKRDIFDRWFFGLGTLNIQTAGFSGNKGAEERLVGLPNVQEVYELVAGSLRRFRGGMSPTQAEEEHATPAGPGVLREILDEVRAIRRSKT